MTQQAPVLSRDPVSHADLRPMLQRFVERRLRHPADSEDIVQETYARLYEYKQTRTIGDVGAFCFTIARNLINDHLRHRHRAGNSEELPGETACAAPRADEILAYRERVDILIRALRAMPPLRREIFTRRRLEEQPIATIAGDLGMTAGAVERHCGRALADLRHALDRRGLGLEKGA
jgi:RNA polymerase sigma factor (sigma-70 family)